MTTSSSTTITPSGPQTTDLKSIVVRTEYARIKGKWKKISRTMSEEYHEVLVPPLSPTPPNPWSPTPPIPWSPGPIVPPYTPVWGPTIPTPPYEVTV